jgi:hypothetical protein
MELTDEPMAEDFMLISNSKVIENRIKHFKNMTFADAVYNGYMVHCVTVHENNKDIDYNVIVCCGLLYKIKQSKIASKVIN